jgi:hypothetical protein
MEMALTLSHLKEEVEKFRKHFGKFESELERVSKHLPEPKNV